MKRMTVLKSMKGVINRIDRELGEAYVTLTDEQERRAFATIDLKKLEKLNIDEGGTFSFEIIKIEDKGVITDFSSLIRHKLTEEEVKRINIELEEMLNDYDPTTEHRMT